MLIVYRVQAYTDNRITSKMCLCTLCTCRSVARNILADGVFSIKVYVYNNFKCVLVVSAMSATSEIAFSLALHDNGEVVN